MNRRTCAALALLLTLTLTGCRLSGGHTDQAGPPPGGWPQPAGDRVTTGMCGLLTATDYTRLGHALRPDRAPGTVTDRTNALDCKYASVDSMTLTLKPTAEAARYYFAADLRDHKQQLTSSHRTSALAADIVGAADESWFDDWTIGTAEQRPVAHEIRVRRGALVVGITLSGDRGKKEGDPRNVLISLADLVLDRLPHVGAKDTGTTHKVQYEVIGTGKAKSIAWEDYTDVNSAGSVDDTRIPWLRTVTMATEPGVQPDDPILRVEAASPKAKVGCLIVVDGTPVAGISPKAGYVDCRGELPEDDSGDSAQPAVYQPTVYQPTVYQPTVYQPAG